MHRGFSMNFLEIAVLDCEAAAALLRNSHTLNDLERCTGPTQQRYLEGSLHLAGQ